jgi:hypothetical protein
MLLNSKNNDIDIIDYFKENIDKKTRRRFQIFQRIPAWYWRDDDGTIKPYKQTDVMEFYSMLAKGQTLTSINIGKHSYEIDLGRKKQKNTSFGPERDLYTEDDSDDILRWKPVPFDYQPENEIIYTLEPSSEEYKRIEKIFYLYVPSCKKASASVLERKKGKYKAINTIRVSKVYNTQSRTRWNTELEKILKNSKHTDPSNIVRLLFYTPKPNSRHSSLLVSPLKSIDDSNPETSSLFILSSDVHYSLKMNGLTSPPKVSSVSNSRSNSPKLTHRSDPKFPRSTSLSAVRSNEISSQTTKQIILAEVIVGEEYYCDIANVSRSFSKNPDSVVSNNHQSWLWYIKEDVRIYPTYIIDWC